MRIGAFVILALAALTLQVTLAPRVVLLGARPDWLLVLAVFIGLHVRGAEAPILAWLIGLGADLVSIERPGLMAITYGLTAAAVHSVREFMFIRHPLTHFSLTLLASLGVQTLMSMYRDLAYHWPVDSPTRELAHAIAVAVWTGLWAVPVHWVLLRGRRLIITPHARAG
ncbi:MAG TPA: rod shape-determining protein MreD [Phycisphaerae bacterium]|jgi:rod shape-determining protein MreD